MSYNIRGKVFDENKVVLPFATIYVSDSKGGHSLHAKNTASDIDGNWVLKDVNDSDFITARMLGYEPETISVKSIPALIKLSPVRDGEKKLNITLKQGEGTKLSEFEVVAERDKKSYSKYYILGGFLFLLIIGTTVYIAKK